MKELLEHASPHLAFSALQCTAAPVDTTVHSTIKIGRCSSALVNKHDKQYYNHLRYQSKLERPNDGGLHQLKTARAERCTSAGNT
jgi:hypothetical protein